MKLSTHKPILFTLITLLFSTTHAHETGEFLQGHTHPAFELNTFLLLFIIILSTIYFFAIRNK